MNTSPFTSAVPAPSAVQIVLTILDALLRAIGERGRPMSWATGVLPVERIMLADAWVRKFRRELKALAAKILDGTLRERPYAPRGPASAPTPPLPRNRAALRVPRRKWWLCAWVPMRAAGCGSQLTHLLRHNEEMQKLVAAERMYWLIRPVCRALAVDPNELTKAAVRGVALWEAAAAARAMEGGRAEAGVIASRYGEPDDIPPPGVTVSVALPDRSAEPGDDGAGVIPAVDRLDSSQSPFWKGPGKGEPATDAAERYHPPPMSYPKGEGDSWQPSNRGVVGIISVS